MDSLVALLFSPLPLPAIISLFALAAAALLYLNTRPGALNSKVDLNSQTMGIKVRRAELSVSRVHVRLLCRATVLISAQCPQDGARKTALLEDNNNLVSYYHDDATTIYEVFQRGLRVSGEDNFLCKMKCLVYSAFLSFYGKINTTCRETVNLALI